MRKKCPHCNAIIEHLQVAANYSEYGRAYGSKDLDLDYEDFDNIDCSDTDYYDYEYTCPECGHYVDEDDLEEEGQEEEQENKKKISNTTKGIMKDSLKQV